MTQTATMSARNLVEDAARLRDLHIPGSPLILANVWDPATARIAEAAGVRAVATASAAIAPANGYEDHGKLPPDVAFTALRRIAQAVKVPVTADLEDGYGLSAETLVQRTIDAGACGLNLEDTNHSAGTLVDADLQSERIASIKTAARSYGFDLVVNARIDVRLHGGSIAEGIRRAQKYFAAGADCVYPIFVSDISAIREFVDLGKTNILFRHGGPSLRDLADAGVARISVGPLLFQLLSRQLQDAIASLVRLDSSALWASEG